MRGCGFFQFWEKNKPLPKVCFFQNGKNKPLPKVCFFQNCVFFQNGKKQTSAQGMFFSRMEKTNLCPRCVFSRMEKKTNLMSRFVFPKLWEKHPPPPINIFSSDIINRLSCYT